MDYQFIQYQVADRIARITLNRPEALNALHSELLKELKLAVETAAVDEAVGVIVLTGAGRAFCAGVDLKALGPIEGADVGATLNSAARDLQTAIETVPKVVIAMVNGFCLTGGLEIALACDLIIAADEAKFGDTHVKWGLRCTWGMSQRLPYRVGELKARELTYTAAMITGLEAERIGLVNRAVPAALLEKEVAALAAKINANSRDAVAAHKALYNRSKRRAMQDGLDHEYGSMPAIRDTLDRLSGFAR